MEVKPGYKQTEVGVIPEEWESASIGEVAEIKVGRDLVENRFSSLRDSSYPFPVYSNTVTNEGLYGFYSVPEYQGDSVTVVGRGVGLGTAFARSGGYGAIGRLLVLLPNRRVDARFLATYVNQRISIFIETGGIPQLTGIQFSKYKTALPPLPEQRAIAEALSDVDGLLGALDRLIAKKRDLKQAAMQQLLTGQTRLPGFHGEWEVKRLGEVTDTDPENLGSETRPDFAFNYISLEDVDQGMLRGHSEQVFRTAPSRARRKLRDNDILVSTVRPNLKSHLLFRDNGQTWVCSTGFCVVRCRGKQSHPGYVFFHMFGHPVARQIEALLTGSNYPAINSTDVRALEIPLPDFDEQTAIAEVLTEMDAELAALEQRREKIHALKQAMMQELLTGRVRLIN